MLRLVDRYQVLGPIGAGGMAEVFVAHDVTLDRPVAIKRLLDTESPTEAHLENLRREARLNAQLHHPNIVTVYDVVRHEGVDHIVSELVDGDSLRDLVAATKPSLLQTIDIAIAIARGLEFAHSRQVIHRDLKTENILIGRDGSVKIADFGIAHSRTEPGAAVKEEGAEGDAPVGTPRVMSPEQSRGEPTDERSDLFSLGVLIYEITAGASPFLCGGTAQTLRAIQTARHRPLADCDAAIPVELSQLVDRLLEKQPSRRPQSAAEVIADLTTIRERVAAASPAESKASALERRRVAVLCLKMDTAETGFVEAERAAERFASFYVRVVADAARSGGEVVSAVAGEIVIGFGHVRAHELDCERAAALAMGILSSRDPDDGVPYSLRAGLDVGDLYVVSGPDKPLMVGPTIAQAARLARAVGPGELIVTTRAQSRLAGRYHLVPRSGLDLGPSYEVVGLATVNAPSSLAAPLVGRESVASTIRAVMARPRSSGARIIAVEGEAGVGKSRLVQELSREWDTRGASVHIARGSQEAQYSPFGALRPMLSTWFGLGPAQDLVEARSRIVEGVARSLRKGDDADAIAALAVVCGSATDADRDRVRSLYQREQRREVEDTVVALLTSEARSREVVVIAEDAHWFDVSSWDVLARLIAEPEGVAVVTTYRSGWDDGWARTEGVTRLKLSRLGTVDARRLVAALAPTLAPTLVDRIIASSAGLPLVLEELTRACVAGSRDDAADPLAAVSSSLGDQVAATLEQLSPVLRRPLELAALLGLSVDRAQLAHATGEGPQYAEHVSALVDRGLLRVDAGDSARLSFPHPLVREEVARRIDRARRLDLHRTIVELFDSDPARFPARPETVARHCEAAALPERAIEAWLGAGTSAAEDGAHATALEHFDRALALVPTCAAEARATELEAAVRSSRGASLAMSGGWGAEAVATNSRQLAAVLRRSGGQPNPMSLWQNWAVGYATGNMPAIMQAIGQIEDLVATSPDPGIFHYLLHCARGITYLHLGRLPHARQALESAERERPKYLPILRELGQPEPVVSPTAYLAWVDLLVGDRNAAFARQTDAETNPSLDVAHRSCAASFGATLALAALDLPGALSRAGVVLSPAGVGLALQHKAAARAVRALGSLHDALLDDAIDVAATIQAMREGFEEWRSGFMRPGALVLCVGMAEACLALSASQRHARTVRDLASTNAREILDFSLHEVTTLDPSIHRYYASEVFRVEALWQRRAGNADGAASALREGRVRAQRLDCGEHGGAWLLLDRIAATSAGQE